MVQKRSWARWYMRSERNPSPSNDFRCVCAALKVGHPRWFVSAATPTLELKILQAHSQSRHLRQEKPKPFFPGFPFPENGNKSRYHIVPDWVTRRTCTLGTSISVNTTCKTIVPRLT